MNDHTPFRFRGLSWRFALRALAQWAARSTFIWIDGVRYLDLPSKVVLALLGIAVCFGLGFAAAMIGGWIAGWLS